MRMGVLPEAVDDVHASHAPNSVIYVSAARAVGPDRTGARGRQPFAIEQTRIESESLDFKSGWSGRWAGRSGQSSLSPAINNGCDMIDITSAMPASYEVGQESLAFDLTAFDGQGAGAEMPLSPRRTGSLPTEEGRLVKDCVSGDAAAWQKLFREYHPRFVFIIQSLLRGGSGAEHAEEIAAAVWFSLCNEGYSQLSQYDPQAGRLLGYLAYLARREIWRVRRSEQSRHSRECSAARKEAIRDEVDRGLAFNEFLATLTCREREFCLSQLLPQTECAAPARFSITNEWQLRSRVRKKLQIYIIEQKRV
jgi:hypothetical protein